MDSFFLFAFILTTFFSLCCDLGYAFANKKYSFFVLFFKFANKFWVGGKTLGSVGKPDTHIFRPSKKRDATIFVTSSAKRDLIAEKTVSS